MDGEIRQCETLSDAAARRAAGGASAVKRGRQRDAKWWEQCHCGDKAEPLWLKEYNDCQDSSVPPEVRRLEASVVGQL